MGKTPLIVSYPFGRWNSLVEKSANELGYKLGITTMPTFTKLPFETDSIQAFRIGRWQIHGDNSSLVPQIRKFEATLSLANLFASRKVK